MTDINHGYIDNYISGIPIFQRNAVESLIEERKRSGHITSGRLLREELENRAKDIRRHGMAFKFIPISPGQGIDASAINKLFEDISIDLKTLYNQVALIASDKARLKAVQEDSFIKVKATILELINQLRLFRFLKLNPEYQDAKYINFNNAINKSTAIPKASVDPKTKTLKLPLSSSNKLATSRFNFNRVKASVNHFGGGLRSDDPNFPIEDSIDNSTDSFWFSTVLSDGVPSHNIRLSHSSTQRALASGTQNGNIYNSNAIVFELIYNFSKTATCNNIKLWPIAEFPVRVIDISYKTNELSTEWITIPEFDPADYSETLDWLEWNGARFSMIALRLLIEQPNYTQHIYHIPTNVVYNNHLWSQISDITYSKLVHNIELDQVLADKIAVEPSQLTYLNELNDLGIEVSDSVLSGSGIRTYDTITNLKDVLTKHLSKAIEQNTTLVEIRKNLFTCGIRSLEVNDNIYEPYAFYESPKFETNANLLEVSLETNEQHRLISDGILVKPFYRTSIEWELQTSDNTVFPIAPLQYLSEIPVSGNTGTQKVVFIEDEMMIINREYYTSITRFPISSQSIIIRKNGNRLPQLIQNSRTTGSSKYNYTVKSILVNQDNYLQTTFNSNFYDPRSIYTISYVADYSAAIIDINSLLNSQRVIEPETFTSVNRDNKVTLRAYPYVEYSIINDELLWSKNSDGLNVWSFIPATGNYSIGQVSLSPTDPNTILGIGTLWLSGVSNIVTNYINGETGAHFKLRGDTKSYKILNVVDNSGLLIQGPLETGFLPPGSAATGLQYVIGKTAVIDGTVYGLDNITYEPITVYVNDIKAVNKTDYERLEHNAFLPQSDNTRIYEYIQAGKNIYLNAPAEGKIEVDYRFLTEYIKINALLRCNKIVKSTDTPIVNDYTIRIRNSKI